MYKRQCVDFAGATVEGVAQMQHVSKIYLSTCEDTRIA